jgi:MFS transporter, ACS family, aldohexuronate transporter
MKRGWKVGRARKTVLLACAIIMPFTGLGVVAPSAKVAVLLFAIGLMAHQAWMANLFTTPSDVFPKQAVGVTNGFGVGVGAIGGALFSGLIPGHVIPILGYVPVLLTMSCFYLIAWLIVHKLMGNLEQISGFEIGDLELEIQKQKA